MPGEISAFSFSEVAASDLSSSQYLAVSIGSTGLGITSVSTQATGILQNAPITGMAGVVAVSGQTYAKYGGTVTKGDFLQVDGSGRLITKVGTGAVVAHAKESGSVNEIHSVILK